MLLATWAQFVTMLFSARNAHLGGINAIRRHLMSIAEDKHLHSPTYYANVVWACMDDAVRHLRMVMPFDALEKANLGGALLQWPTTRLHDVA